MISVLNILVDRIIQLYNYPKGTKAKIFNNFITPIYNDFEQVHVEYLHSFKDYRRLIEDQEWSKNNNKFLERLENDNRYTMHTRIKILSLADESKKNKGKAVGPFIDAIYGYLIDPHIQTDKDNLIPEDSSTFLASLKVDIDSRQDFEVIERKFGSQVWRKTLAKMLHYIFAEEWRKFIDPTAGRPPMTNEEAIKELSDDCNIDLNGQDKLSELKITLAYRTLDDIVDEMQNAYKKVTNEYDKLKVQSI